VNAFVFIIPIAMVLALGPLFVTPTSQPPQSVQVVDAPRISAAAWREQQREERFRRAMREETVRPEGAIR
jgi:hypothetical protein